MSTLEGLNGGTDVGCDLLEIVQRAAAVAHAPVVKTQHREALARQLTRQQCELAVAASAVLRAAHHHQHTQIIHRRGGRRQRQHGLQGLALAVEAQALLAVFACRHRTHAISSRVMGSRSGASSISVVCQNAGPATTAVCRW